MSILSKLRNRLSLIIIGLSIAPLIVTITIISINTFNRLVAESYINLTQIETRFQEAIEASINERINELMLLDEAYNIGELPKQDQRNILNSLLVNRDAYERIALLKPDGTEILRVSRFEVGSNTELTEYSSDHVYQTVIDSSSVSVSEVFFDKLTKEPILRIGIPYFNLRTNTLEAVLLADFRFRQIWNTLANLQSEISGAGSISVFLTDSKGLLIAHPNSSEVLREKVFNIPTQNSEVPNLDGEQAFTVVNSFPIENIKFVIVAQHITSDVLKPIFDTLLGTGLITLITTVIIIFATTIIVLQITRPIESLSNIAQRLAKGNYATRATVRGQDELRHLAESFNTMAEAIEYRDQIQIVKLEEQLKETEIARMQAEQSDQVKSSFLASMSHELRTPLNAVINFTKFVAKGQLGPVNEKQAETLFEVVDSAKHLLNLINDVLDMSKIESGSLNLFVTNGVDLQAIINQVASTGKTLLDDKPVEIRKQVAEDLPPIRGDRQRLIQIMLNIVSNACKFTKEGSITINAYRESDEVVISVTDTGPGIAPSDHAIVFEAFKQTDSGLRQGGGTGLGMPITKSLVEAHGGRISLKSQLNEGATFTITLPVTSDTLVPTLS